ncbi:MAG: glycoside hydrolase family 95 protein, partial [Chitinophagaceae bacterium]|nr:glycoside hydrolase family 95 protein [Chitinophagaceae bacterium]
MRPLKMLLILCSFSSLQAPAQQDLQFWYTSPASQWTDALPVGNGRLGAMVFGKYDRERIQLNEESVWAGSKINNNNPKAGEFLPHIRQALFGGSYKTALDLASQYLVGTPPRIRSYQPLGNFFIEYAPGGAPEEYRRSLTLNTGIAKTEFRIGNNRIEQEVYASAPQDVIVVHIHASSPSGLLLYLTRKRDVYEYNAKENLAYFNGQIFDEEDSLRGPGGKHMRLSAAVKILQTDGKPVPHTTDSSAGFKLVDFRNITLLITGATDYNPERLDLDGAVDPFAVCLGKINKASGYSAAVLKKHHIRDHRSFFDRVHFTLGEKDSLNDLPTDKRLARVKSGEKDLGLIVQYYQFGRYLLMGSSRSPGRLPANLQGIWNESYDAPWNADFHTNINLQMNYWPA